MGAGKNEQHNTHEYEQHEQLVDDDESAEDHGLQCG